MVKYNLYNCLLYLISLFYLSGCVYYGDIHSNATPLTPSDLGERHVYQIPAKKLSTDWWQRFHDPQLNQLIEIALIDSPNMKIVEARVRKAEHFTELARAALFPFVNFNGEVQRAKFSEFGLVPPPFNGKIFNIGTLGFNLDYDLDFWGKNKYILTAEVSKAYAAQADKAAAKLIISAMVANTYWQLLSNIAELAYARENESLANKMASIIQSRAKQGFKSDIEVKTVTAAATMAKISVQQYQRARKLSSNRLAILLGKNPFMTSIITKKFVYHPLDLQIERLTANVLANRPDIDAAKHRMQAAAHYVSAAQTRFFPNINLQALFSYEGVGLQHLFDQRSQHNAITAAIDLPIFDAGVRRANLAARYDEYDMAVNTYNLAILNALGEVSNQLTILSTLKKQLNLQNQVVADYQRKLKLYHLQYQHGIIDYLEIIIIKQTLLQQQEIQLTLQSNHQQAIVNMLKILGGNQQT